MCNGIATRLRHVTDYPLARTKDEAVLWFEGSPVASPHSTDDGEGPGGRRGNTKRTDSEGTRGKDFTMSDHHNVEHNEDTVEIEDDGTFSSYGTTQVNILTLKEVPVS